MKSVAEFPEQALGWLNLRSADWPVYPLKRVVESNKSTLPDSTDPDYEIKYVDISSVSLSEGVKKTEGLKFENAPSRARRIVRDGDVLVSTVRTYLRAIARIEEAPENLIASTGFAVLSPQEKLDSSYFGLFCTAHPFVEAIVAQSTGASYPATNASDIVRLPIPVPPLDVQQQIASFIEKQIKEIDDLITKKRDLLKLLAEKRSALITRAVTKGLDPKSEMKRSGIDWLGDIPAHWQIAPLWVSLGKLESGVSVNSKDTPAGEDELGILKTSCVYSGEFDAEENKVVFDPIEIDRLKCPVKKGEVIVSRMNTPDLVGAAGLVRDDHNNLFLPDRLWQTAFVNSAPLLPEFAFLFLSSTLYRAQISSLATGSSPSMKNISKDDFLKLKVATPTEDEQQKIVDQVSADVEQIRLSQELVERAIIRLNEYRAAIVTKAVTGELEVA